MLTNVFITKTKVNSLFRESSKSLIELATFNFFFLWKILQTNRCCSNDFQNGLHSG